MDCSRQAYQKTRLYDKPKKIEIGKSQIVTVPAFASLMGWGKFTFLLCSVETIIVNKISVR